MPEQCTQQAIEDAAVEAGGTELYGPASVLVTESDSVHNTVSFMVGTVEVSCEWTRDFVWALCPSTLNCDDVTLPAVNATGTLYLSERLIDEYELTSISIKWPVALPAAPEYRPLEVWPTGVTLQGVDVSGRRAGPPVTIDLMDPTLAAPGQELALGDKPVTLQLTQEGFQRFFKPWNQQESPSASNDNGGSGAGAPSKPSTPSRPSK